MLKLKKQKKKSNKKQKGAALLMTLLVISILSMAALAAGNTMISERKFTYRHTNKETAYWAAEAGIEKALLYYNLNEEEPVYPNGSNEIDKIFQRVNLKTRNTSSITYGSDSFSEPGKNERVVDWRIYDEKGFTGKKFILKKDEGLTFRDTADSTFLSGGWSVVDENGNSATLNSPNKAGLYWRKNLANGDFKTGVEKNLSNPSFSISLIDPDVKTVQLKAFMSKADADAGKKMRLTVDSDGKIGGPYVYIESIGYFHGVRKKLTVKLNREETTLFNALDYAIFTKEDLPNN